MPFGLLLYTLAGFLVGTSIGLTGIGGGSMMAPLLILVFHIPAAKAVQLDFLYLTPTKLVGAWQHYQRKTVDPTLTGLLALGAIPGTILGSVYVAQQVAANPNTNITLRHVIGYFILVSAALIIVQLGYMWHRKVGEIGDHRAKFNTPRGILMVVVGFLLGILVGATSIGAGSVLLPLLVLLLRVRMRELVSTDVVLGAIIAIVGALAHSLAQSVSWDIVIALLIGSMPGALVGARLIGVVSTRLVRGCVSGALIVVGLILIGVLSTS
jgi:uncharacterized membrane protein YfcA